MSENLEASRVGRVKVGHPWKSFEYDYLLRTIENVRQHRGADNCWPQWANIFADEIERCWKLLDALSTRDSGALLDVPSPVSPEQEQQP